MATIQARGAASVSSLSDARGTTGELSLRTPAGWHLTFWGASVLIIAFFLWAL